MNKQETHIWCDANNSEVQVCSKCGIAKLAGFGASPVMLDPCPPWGSQHVYIPLDGSKQYESGVSTLVELGEIYDHISGSYVFGAEGDHYRAAGQAMSAMIRLGNLIKKLEDHPKYVK